MKKLALVGLIISSICSLQATDTTVSSWQVPGMNFVREHATAMSTFGAGAAAVIVLNTIELPGKFRVANDASRCMCSTVSDAVRATCSKICSMMRSLQTRCTEWCTHVWCGSSCAKK